MTFAVRPIGQSRRWEFVGISAVQTTSGAALNLPETAQAGDVCFIAGADTVAGTAPSGYTIIAAGSSLNYYRICSGGEATAGRPTTSGWYCTVLYRPVGGVAAFLAGATDAPAADRVMSLSVDKSCLIFAVGGSANAPGFVWSAPTLPEPFSTLVELVNGGASSFALQMAASMPVIGTSATGVMRLNGSAILRQTFGIFTL